MLTDIEDRKQAEALLAGEKRILEMVAKGDSLPRILDSLCRLVEDHTKDALTAILLVEDGRLWHVGKPSLPRDYVEAIDAIISVQPTVGSCGPSAYFARQVIVSDIMSNPLFDGLRNLALPLYRAVWSTPIMSSEGKVIGTFAMYYREPRSPSPHDQEIIGQITHLAGVAIQRARLDHALAEREAKIRRLVDANIIGIYIWNFEGDILDTNDAFLRMVGYDREDVASGRLRWTELTPAEWRDNDARAVAELKMTGILQPFEKEYFRKDGNRVPVLIGLAAFEENGNEGVAFVLDLTERKLAEEELRASEELKRRIIESSRDCIKALDLDGNLLFMSSGGQQLLEIDNIQPYLNSCWINFWQPEDRPRISEAVAAARAGGIGQFQAFCPSAKGAPRWWDVVTTPICNADGQPEQLLSVSRDITERKRAEEEARESERRYREVQMELAHANRVATMGQLTASIAHEVNQPVAATMTNAQAALRFLAGQTADLDEVRQILNDIVKDGKRAGEVIGRIRDLIKKAPPRRDRWEINGAIHEVIELTRGEAVKNSISVQTELADGLLLIRGDRVQLQQVILNLIINAVEAMSGPGDGPRELLISSGTAESGGVLVTMRDSGPGLAPATLERVFESFYTTKPGGLGLGLSICRSIVEAHGGRLWASANVPGGAVFQFTVPAVEGM
jgi:PAS domain S-box-containing protein